MQESDYSLPFLKSKYFSALTYAYLVTMSFELCQKPTGMFAVHQHGTLQIWFTDIFERLIDFKFNAAAAIWAYFQDIFLPWSWQDIIGALDSNEPVCGTWLFYACAPLLDSVICRPPLVNSFACFSIITPPLNFIQLQKTHRQSSKNALSCTLPDRYIKTFHSWT